MDNEAVSELYTAAEKYWSALQVPWFRGRFNQLYNNSFRDIIFNVTDKWTIFDLFDNINDWRLSLFKSTSVAKFVFHENILIVPRL